MLHTIVHALVDNPEKVLVKTEWTSDGAVFTLQVHADDVGKVIRKQGRTARAIRTIIAGVASKLHRRYTVVIDNESAEAARNSA